MQVGADQTLTMDAAHAEPVTATVDGVDTEAFSVIAAYEQTARRGPVWSDFAVGVKSGSVFVAPLHRVETGVGAFQVYSAFSLKAPGNGPSPYQYDLIHPLHPDVPAEVNYRLTAAEQAALARIDERFHHLDTPGTTTSSVRYGLSPTGNLLTSNEVWDRAWTLPDQRADYVSPGYLWSEEAVYDNIPGLRYPR